MGLRFPGGIANKSRTLFPRVPGHQRCQTVFPEGAVDFRAKMATGTGSKYVRCFCVEGLLDHRLGTRFLLHVWGLGAMIAQEFRVLRDLRLAVS